MSYPLLQFNPAFLNSNLATLVDANNQTSLTIGAHFTDFFARWYQDILLPNTKTNILTFADSGLIATANATTHKADQLKYISETVIVQSMLRSHWSVAAGNYYTTTLLQTTPNQSDLFRIWWTAAVFYMQQAFSNSSELVTTNGVERYTRSINNESMLQLALLATINAIQFCDGSDDIATDNVALNNFTLLSGLRTTLVNSDVTLNGLEAIYTTNMSLIHNISLPLANVKGIYYRIPTTNSASIDSLIYLGVTSASTDAAIENAITGKINTIVGGLGLRISSMLTNYRDIIEPYGYTISSLSIGGTNAITNGTGSTMNEQVIRSVITTAKFNNLIAILKSTSDANLRFRIDFTIPSYLEVPTKEYTYVFKLMLGTGTDTGVVL